MIEREQLEMDVVFVGAGPANLAAALHLKKKAREHDEFIDKGIKKGRKIGEPEIAVVEKGAFVGAHILSGAVMDPIAIRELMPDFLEQGCPVDSAVTSDAFWYLTESRKIDAPIIPPPLKNKGKYIVSLSRVCEWLAEKCEAEGINIFPEFPASEILFDENDRVIGVRTGDKGIDKEGKTKGNFEPGVDLLAKVTVLGEGSRGSLAKQLTQRLGLDEGKEPQVFSLGVKEIWEVPAGNFEEGKVVHTLGFPSDTDTYGGGWIYGMKDNKISIGYVTGLDYKDALIDPHAEFQKFKTHPAVAEVLRGGKMLKYGAKTINAGGYWTMPKLFADGVYRTTIAASAQRLAGKEFITVREIPEEIAFRDSHGRFGGSKVYLLAGDLNNRFLVKDVEPDRVGLTATVKQAESTKTQTLREGLTATVPVTVRVQPTHRARSGDTNGGEEEEEEGAPLSPQEIIFGHFASCKGAQFYKPSLRDEQAVAALVAEGFSLPQILAGIERAFSQHTGKTPIRHFTFCVPIIRDSVTNAGDSASPQNQVTIVPAHQDSALGHEDSDSSAGNTGSARASLPAQLPEVILLTFTLAAGTPPTEIEQRRLLWLAEECAPAAQVRQENVWDWLVEALKESAGRADNLLTYTIAVMRKRANSTLEQTAKEKSASPNSGLVRVAKRTRHTPDPALATLQAMQNLFPQEKSDGPA